MPLRTVLLVLLLVLTSVSPSPYAQARKIEGDPPYEVAQSKNAPAANDQRGTRNTPLVVDVEKNPISSRESAEAKGKEDTNPPFKEGEILLTVVIAFAAVLQAVGVFIQANINHRQRTALENTERAWLSTSIYQPSPAQMDMESRSLNEGLGISITVENVGRTPSRVVDSFMRVVMADCMDPEARPVVAKLPSTPAYRSENDKTPTITAVDTVWMPGQKFVYQALVAKPFFLKDMVNWKINNKVLCVYGFVAYTDVFGKPHETRFCYIYQRIRTPLAFTDSATGELLFPPEFVLGGPDAYNRIT